jgi:hypothetical protein
MAIASLRLRPVRHLFLVRPAGADRGDSAGAGWNWHSFGRAHRSRTCPRLRCVSDAISQTAALPFPRERLSIYGRRSRGANKSLISGCYSPGGWGPYRRRSGTTPLFCRDHEGGSRVRIQLPPAVSHQRTGPPACRIAIKRASWRCGSCACRPSGGCWLRCGNLFSPSASAGP